MLIKFIKTVKFGHKNFYEQLGLSQHFSIKGLLRRWERNYPRYFQTFKFVFVFSMITSTSMAIIPGTIIPFQRQLKQFIIARLQNLNRILFISILDDKISYISNIYKCMKYMLQENFANEQNIVYYLNMINNQIQGSEKSKSTRFSGNSVKIQNIRHSVMLLNNILQKCQSNNSTNNIIKNQLFIQQLRRIYVNSVLGVVGKIPQFDKSNYIQSLKLLQYLLKFQKNDKKQQIISKFLEILRQPDKRFLSFMIIKNQSLKNQLKSIYKAQAGSRAMIQQILQILDAQVKKH